MAYNIVFEKSTDCFSYDKRTNKFIASLTELGCKGIDSKCAEFFQPLEKGYGFVLVSKQTGKKIVMRHIGTNKIKSDWDELTPDIKSFVFKPANGNANFSLEIAVGE